MSALDDFLWEHREAGVPIADDRPEDFAGAASTALYDAYRAHCESQDRSVLKQPEWRAAMAAAGHQTVKVEAGVVYPGLTVESRRDRAEARVVRDLRNAAFALERAGAVGDHRLRRHADGSECCHALPPDQIEAIARRVAEAVDAYRADGTVGSMVEHRYGMYLRQRPGDPPFTLARQYAAALSYVQSLDVEAEALRARIDAGSAPEPRRYVHEVPDQSRGRLMLDKMAGATGADPTAETPEYAAWFALRNDARAAERRLEEVMRERRLAMATMASVEGMIRPAPLVDDVPDQTATGDPEQW